MMNPCVGRAMLFYLSYLHPYIIIIREVGSSASRDSDNIVQKHTLWSPNRLSSVVTMGKTPPCMGGGLRPAVDCNRLVMMMVTWFLGSCSLTLPATPPRAAGVIWWFSLNPKKGLNNLERKFVVFLQSWLTTLLLRWNFTLCTGCQKP